MERGQVQLAAAIEAVGATVFFTDKAHTCGEAAIAILEHISMVALKAKENWLLQTATSMKEHLFRDCHMEQGHGFTPT
jgi:hypothetical protein